MTDKVLYTIEGLVAEVQQESHELLAQKKTEESSERGQKLPPLKGNIKFYCVPPFLGQAPLHSLERFFGTALRYIAFGRFIRIKKRLD
jgi:hypothetical protein